ncbi:unnamed protein product [Caenorhabditis sp. 36 PRJEB53466]|nr:unnamed protein product [Caenorhabditis sp. 36 PRJEB53466]
MSACAVWHFTPLVIVKANFNEEEMTAAKNALKKLSKTQRTTYNVLSSKSGSSIEVSDADHSEHSYRAKVTRTKDGENGD